MVKLSWIGRWLVVGLACALASGCHSHSLQEQLDAAGATPEKAVTTALADLKTGQFEHLAQHLLPPPAYQQLRKQWPAIRARQLARVSDADRKRFARTVKTLTAPDAKKKLMAELEPLLKNYKRTYQPRVLMGVGIMQLLAGTAITRSKDLSAAQKGQVRDLLDAVANWVKNTDWGDTTKARKAVGIAVDTARALHMTTLDQVYKLDFDQAMQHYHTVWQGGTKVLALYGLSLADVLDSVQVKNVAQKGQSATVTLAGKVLGQPLTVQLAMVKQGQRWYLAKVLKAWQAQRARIAAAASAANPTSAPAPATSAVPAAPATTSGAPTGKP